MIISNQRQNCEKKTRPTITEQMKNVIKRAVQYMKGIHRRRYMAEARNAKKRELRECVIPS